MLKCWAPLCSRFDRALASSLVSSGPAPSCGPFDCFRDLEDCLEVAGVPGLDGFFGAAGVAALDDFREVAGVAGLGGFGGLGEGSSFVAFGGGSVGFGGFLGFGFLGFLDVERPREDDDTVCARTLVLGFRLCVGSLRRILVLGGYDLDARARFLRHGRRASSRCPRFSLRLARRRRRWFRFWRGCWCWRWFRDGLSPRFVRSLVGSVGLVLMNSNRSLCDGGDR